jgi:hypothetical protein
VEELVAAGRGANETRARYFRSRFLGMLIYHVPMNLAICYTGHGAAAV